MNRREDQLQLPDGRILGYRKYGVTDGRPLFYFHGTPGSGIEFELFAGEAGARRHGHRIVVPDRPGMGHSTFLAGRTTSDWPADLAALAKHLEIGRFGVLVYSGGAPYAVATALALPDRVTLMGL